MISGYDVICDLFIDNGFLLDVTTNESSVYVFFKNHDVYTKYIAVSIQDNNVSLYAAIKHNNNVNLDNYSWMHVDLHSKISIDEMVEFINSTQYNTIGPNLKSTP